MLRSLHIGLTVLAISAPVLAQTAIPPHAADPDNARCSIYMTEEECQAHRHILRILPASSANHRAYLAMVSHLLSEREALCGPQHAGQQAAAEKRL